MKTTIAILIFTLFCTATTITAQNKQNIIEDVEGIPLGDGRYQWRDPSNREPLNGEYRIIVSRNQYMVAHFKDGLLNGSRMDYKDNSLQAKSNYKDGILNGKYTLYYADGQIKEQRLFNKKGKLHGKLVSYFSDGSIEKEAHYVDGSMEGSYKSYISPGKLFIESNYKNDHLYGIEKKYNDEYTSEGFNLTNFKKKGEYKETWINGKPKKVEYYSDEGEKQGVWKRWYKDGTLEFTTDYDKTPRESFYYYEDGSTNKHLIYNSEGEVSKEKEYYPQTNVLHKEKAYYKPFHYTFKIYYDDGKLREEGRSENSYITHQKEYYRNQQLRCVKEIPEGSYYPRLEVVERYDDKGNALPIE